jgi:hypothetical protein
MATATDYRTAVYETYRDLLRMGFSPAEAGGILAHDVGLDRHAEGQRTCNATWRWQEVAQLLFLHWCVESGRLHEERQPG